MPISGIVITCQADQTNSVVSTIRKSGVAEIHGASPEGKVVAVIEAPSVEEEVRIVRSLAVLKGVINVHLAYHHIEDIPDPIGSC
jgi:nitrate reductase NapD